MYWLFCYDISNTRKRNKVSKYLSSKGIRIQKSIFLLEGSFNEVDNEVKKIIDICKSEAVLSSYPLYDYTIKSIQNLGRQAPLNLFCNCIII